MPPRRTLPASERKREVGKRLIRISIYLDAEELTILDRAAERLGMARSELLRLLTRNAMFVTVSMPPLSVELSEAAQKLVE